MNETLTLISSEAHQTQRAARLETWAEYLCVPIKYVRQRLRDVTTKASGIDREGREYREGYYLEQDVAARIPEYKMVQELEAAGNTHRKIRQAIFRLLLKNVGLSDRRGLEMENPLIFPSRDFGIYGKGKSFYAHITGKKFGTKGNVTKKDLPKIADALDLPELSEERKEEIRGLLKAKGYIDCRSLKVESYRYFEKLNFGKPYGSGRILKKWLGLEELQGHWLVSIADTLSLPDFAEEMKTEMLDLLKTAGYPDRRSLQLGDATVFQRQKFGRYGGGRKFFTHVTGDLPGHSLQNHHLLTIADSLGLRELSEDRKQEMCSLLKIGGYSDRRSIMMAHHKTFETTEFGQYGKLRNFFKWVTGEVVGANGELGMKDREKIADILELPVLSEERKGELRTVLKSAGYPDRRSLEMGDRRIFIKTGFGIYGTGKIFYQWLTGEVAGDFSKEYMVRIGDILDLSPLCEERKMEMRNIAIEMGYGSRSKLEAENVRVFVDKAFASYGNGRQFYRWLTGKPAETFQKKHMLEIADILEFPVE